MNSIVITQYDKESSLFVANVQLKGKNSLHIENRIEITPQNLHSYGSLLRYDFDFQRYSYFLEKSPQFKRSRTSYDNGTEIRFQETMLSIFFEQLQDIFDCYNDPVMDVIYDISPDKMDKLLPHLASDVILDFDKYSYYIELFSII